MKLDSAHASAEIRQQIKLEQRILRFAEDNHAYYYGTIRTRASLAKKSSTLPSSSHLRARLSSATPGGSMMKFEPWLPPTRQGPPAALTRLSFESSKADCSVRSGPGAD